MATLVILSIACLAVGLVLLACLKGFTQALRHKKVSGTFVSIENDSRPRPKSSASPAGSIDFPGRSALLEKPDRRRVCGSTAALVEMAILLRSPSASGHAAASGSDRNDARLRQVARLRHRIHVRRSGVQPLGDS
jgi:hypothetical protein